MWPAFFIRVDPVSSRMKPPIIKITKTAEIITHRLFIKNTVSIFFVPFQIVNVVCILAWIFISIYVYVRKPNMDSEHKKKPPIMKVFSLVFSNAESCVQLSLYHFLMIFVFMSLLFFNHFLPDLISLYTIFYFVGNLH